MFNNKNIILDFNKSLNLFEKFIYDIINNNINMNIFTHIKYKIYLKYIYK